MPPEITIKLEEYDHMKIEMNKLWEAHEMIRQAYRLFNGAELTEKERQNLQHDFDHFIFKHGLLMYDKNN